MHPGPRPSPLPTEDLVHSALIEPPLPPGDRGRRGVQDRDDRRPRVAVAQQQEDVGTLPDLGVRVGPIVAEQRVAVGRGESDTGHRLDSAVGSGDPVNGAGAVMSRKEHIVALKAEEREYLAGLVAATKT